MYNLFHQFYFTVIRKKILIFIQKKTPLADDVSYLCFSSLGKVFLSEIGDGSVDVLDSCVWYSTSGKTRTRDVDALGS